MVLTVRQFVLVDDLATLWVLLPANLLELADKSHDQKYQEQKGVVFEEAKGTMCLGHLIQLETVECSVEVVAVREFC